MKPVICSCNHHTLPWCAKVIAMQLVICQDTHHLLPQFYKTKVIVLSSASHRYDCNAVLALRAWRQSLMQSWCTVHDGLWTLNQSYMQLQWMPQMIAMNSINHRSDCNVMLPCNEPQALWHLKKHLKWNAQVGMHKFGEQPIQPPMNCRSDCDDPCKLHVWQQCCDSCYTLLKVVKSIATPQHHKLWGYD